MRFPRERRFRPLPVRAVVPNLLTLVGLCAGLSAIRFALEGNFQVAVIAIYAAGILDGVDGQVARLMKGESKFGAELDSLADFMSFGVAPVIVVYLWTMQTLGGIAWIAVLLYAVAMALRLARYNASKEVENRPEWSDRFFTGVPAPGGAVLVMFPMAAYFATDGEAFLRNPWLSFGFAVLMGILMVSRLPTYSQRAIPIRRGHVLQALLISVVLIAIWISFPWQACAIGCIYYLCTMPVSAWRYRKLAATLPEKGNEDAADDEEDDEEILSTV